MITHDELALSGTTDTTVTSLHTQVCYYPSLTLLIRNRNIGICWFFSHLPVAGNLRPISVVECPGVKQCREIIQKKKKKKKNKKTWVSEVEPRTSTILNVVP